jgi:GNAT superfamily N-acetyltransferase
MADPKEQGCEVKDVNYFLREREGFLVSTDPLLLDFDRVFQFLADANWWTELTPQSLERALRNSLCFSLVEGDQQIGMARVITDFVTYAYLCDVFITKERRKRGLGSWLVQCVLEHPDIRNLKRVALITHDAQELYRRIDFNFLPDCNRYMERLQ